MGPLRVYACPPLTTHSKAQRGRSGATRGMIQQRQSAAWYSKGKAPLGTAGAGPRAAWCSRGGAPRRPAPLGNSVALQGRSTAQPCNGDII